MHHRVKKTTGGLRTTQSSVDIRSASHGSSVASEAARLRLLRLWHSHVGHVDGDLARCSGGGDGKVDVCGGKISVWSKRGDKREHLLRSASSRLSLPSRARRSAWARSRASRTSFSVRAVSWTRGISLLRKAVI